MVELLHWRADLCVDSATDLDPHTLSSALQPVLYE